MAMPASTATLWPCSSRDESGRPSRKSRIDMDSQFSVVGQRRAGVWCFGANRSLTVAARCGGGEWRASLPNGRGSDWNLLAGQFVHQAFGIVELAQSLGHGGGVDGHGAVGGSVVDVIAHQGFDVAVEDQADDFTFGIDDRRSGIAADDVVGGDEIEGRGQVEFVAAFLVTRGQVERSLIVEAGGAVV